MQDMNPYGDAIGYQPYGTQIARDGLLVCSYVVSVTSFITGFAKGIKKYHQYHQKVLFHHPTWEADVN